MDNESMKCLHPRFEQHPVYSPACSLHLLGLSVPRVKAFSASCSLTNHVRATKDHSSSLVYAFMSCLLLSFLECVETNFDGRCLMSLQCLDRFAGSAITFSSFPLGRHLFFIAEGIIIPVSRKRSSTYVGTE